MRTLNLATRSVTSDKTLAHNSVEMNFHIEKGSETSQVFIRGKRVCPHIGVWTHRPIGGLRERETGTLTGL